MRLRSRSEAFESHLGVDAPEYAGGSEGGREGVSVLSGSMGGPKTNLFRI